MARLINVEVVCDQCQDTDPTVKVETADTVQVGFDGKPYELDLCQEHLAAFQAFRRLTESRGRALKDEQQKRRKPGRMDDARTASGEYVCTQCGEIYGSGQGLASHQRTAHDARVVRCEICGKECQGGAGLKSHQRIHSSKPGVACPHCGKPYMNRAALGSHLRKIHDDPRLPSQMELELLQAAEAEVASA